MNNQGVSTRKVSAITEQLCGTAASSTHVSRAAALMNDVVQAWRTCLLGEVDFLYRDARYTTPAVLERCECEKVHMDG